jgi:rubredoxin
MEFPRIADTRECPACGGSVEIDFPLPETLACPHCEARLLYREIVHDWWLEEADGS